MKKKLTLAELEAEAELFLAAGRRYWDAAHNFGISGAVIFIKDTEGFGCLFSRGEYVQQMIYNIEGLGPTTYFGSAKVDDE